MEKASCGGRRGDHVHVRQLEGAFPHAGGIGLGGSGMAQGKNPDYKKEFFLYWGGTLISYP